MATPERQEPRLHTISQEEPIEYGPFKRDYTMLLLVALFLIGALVLWYSGKVGVSWAGWVFVIAEVVLAWFLIRGLPGEHRTTSRLASGSRKATQKVGGLAGRNTHLAELPEAHPAKPGKSVVIKKLGRVDIKSFELTGGMMGVAHDRLYSTYCATFECHFHSFLLDDTSTLERRLAGWAALLDRLAIPGSRIAKLAFRDQTLYAEPLKAARVLDEIREGAGLRRESPPNQAVLLRRLEELGEESFFHRTTMTVSISTPDQKKTAEKLSGGLEELLATELQSLLAIALGTGGGRSPIGLRSAQVLTRSNLVLENRLALDPVYGQPFWQRARHSTEEAMITDDIATPAYADFKPRDHCVVGRTYHKGFHVKEPTQRGILPLHFWNLLEIPVTKTVTAVFYGIPPNRAQAGAELRRHSTRGRNRELLRLGRDVKSVHEFAEDAAKTHEDEIARSLGHVVRARCYIDLTAPSLDDLEANQMLLENSLWDTRFSLLDLDGRQHLAPSVSMPLARGLALPEKGILRWIDM